MIKAFRADKSPITLGDELGRGGEAAVLAVQNEPSQVAKIYHSATYERIAKLQAMLANPPQDPTAGQNHVSICWPTDLVFDYSSRCLGFLMPKIDFATAVPVFKLYNPKDRWKCRPGFTWRYLLRTAVNISSAIEAIHAKGYVVGDLNESNIMVADTALVSLVDCDSMQVPKGGSAFYRCPVGKPEYTAPELQGKDFSAVDRTPANDNFALAVLLFQLLMEGIHPYAGVCQGPEMTLEERIRNGDSPYAGSRNIRPMPIAPPFELLPRELQALFVRCFLDGHTSPAVRPDAREWRVTLAAIEPELLVCEKNPQHVYGKHLAIYQCPWCARAETFGGLDPFPQPGQQVALPVPPPRPPSVGRVSTAGSAPRVSPSQPASTSGWPSKPATHVDGQKHAIPPPPVKRMSTATMAGAVIAVTTLCLGGTFLWMHSSKSAQADAPDPAACVVSEASVPELVHLTKAGTAGGNSNYDVEYTMPSGCASGSLTINGEWIANFQKASDDGKIVHGNAKVRPGVRLKAAIFSGVEGTGTLLASSFIQPGGKALVAGGGSRAARSESDGEAAPKKNTVANLPGCQIANVDDFAQFSPQSFGKDSWTYQVEFSVPRDCQKGTLTVEGTPVAEYNTKKLGGTPLLKVIHLGPNARFKVAIVAGNGEVLASKYIETKPSPGAQAESEKVYAAGGDVTSPAVVSMPAAAYTDLGRQQKVEGTVIVDMVVGADGKARDAKIAHSLGAGLDERAIEAVQGATFRPATKGGQPVNAQYRMNVNFKLPTAQIAGSSFDVVHEHTLGLVGQGCSGRLIIQQTGIVFESDTHPVRVSHDDVVGVDAHFPAFTTKDRKHWKFHADAGRKERGDRNAEMMKAIKAWYAAK